MLREGWEGRDGENLQGTRAVLASSASSLVKGEALCKAVSEFGFPCVAIA